MYIAIVKRVKDMADQKPYKGLPPDYPVECAELPFEEDADMFKVLHPEVEIVTLEQYRGMEKAFAIIHAHATAPKPGFFKRIFSK